MASVLLMSSFSRAAKLFELSQRIGTGRRPEVGTTPTICLAKVSRNATISV
jgi:hypothetical protein